jgi:nicotinamide-nucleotide amidase
MSVTSSTQCEGRHMDFQEAGGLLRQRSLTIAIMESCSGGLLSHLATSVPGCGDFYIGGIVAYATAIKERLGVERETLRTRGVVSAETAAAMAALVRRKLGADIGLGITGVAGPDPQDGVPVGVVHIAMDGGGRLPDARVACGFGDIGLDAIKRSAVNEAIRLLLRSLTAANER